METLVLLWKRLRRMSSALVLLSALAVAALIATFIPQQPVVAPTVRRWREGSAGPGAGVARILDWFGLFDVFGSWWFGVVVVLLFTSLTACLVPRYRVFWRNVRKPPVAGRNLDRLTHAQRWTTSLPPAAVVATADGVLRTYRTRRTTGPSGDLQLAVERGHWREGGSLVFHTSFYLLLVGSLLGQALGFTGQIDLVEGTSFADTPLGYDTTVPGRFWSPEDHDGYVVRLDDFTVTYLPTVRFTADDFVSEVTVLEDGVEVARGESRVNRPFRYGSLTYYQRGFGFAPRIELRRPGADADPLYAEDLVLRSDQRGLVWTGRGKVAVGTADGRVPQIGLDVVFVADADIAADGTVSFRSPEARDPRLVASLYVGDDLGLDRAVPISTLQWPEEALVDQVMLQPGDTVALLGGELEIAFPELKMWSGFQVSHQPYRWVLLLAGSLVLTGLIPSLYSYRRRLWVEARPVGDGTEVVLAGVALHRQPTFDEEFARLHARLQRAIPATAQPHADAARAT